MTQNWQQAHKLYKFAAMRGNVKAQNALGQLYERGEGVEKDDTQARFWYEIAAHYGHKQAKKNLKALLKA